MAQESFIRAYDRLGLFDVERPFGLWIRRVAANVCLNDLQRKSSPHLPLDDEHDLPLQSPGTNPEIVYELMERADRPRAAILSLPLHYRAVAERNSLRRTAWGTVVLYLASLTPFAGWFGVLVYISWLGLGALILSFFQKSGAIGESYASQH